MRTILARERKSGRERTLLTRINSSLALLFFLPLTLLASPDGAAKGDDAGAPVSPPRVATSSPVSRRHNAFDGERAFAHVKKMVDMGPRPPGSAELARTRQYIISELKSYGLNVSTDEFRAKTPVGMRAMVNITAELAGETPDYIILASHYDTKLFKEFRFVGANDSGSSSGVLLELARVVAAAGKPRFTYRFVFFDGEEAFCKRWEECRTADGPDNTYGSRRYVARLIARGELKRARLLILLDMVGYKSLELGRDPTSTTWIVDVIWQTARELGHRAQFVDREEGIGGDDHEPFLRAGIEAVDIIQLNSYPYWHTADDTLDKISPRSLKTVGDVVLGSLPRIEERLLSKRASS